MVAAAEAAAAREAGATDAGGGAAGQRAPSAANAATLAQSLPSPGEQALGEGTAEPTLGPGGQRRASCADAAAQAAAGDGAGGSGDGDGGAAKPPSPHSDAAAETEGPELNGAGKQRPLGGGRPAVARAPTVLHPA
jgi:hypothetical protein